MKQINLLFTVGLLFLLSCKKNDTTSPPPTVEKEYRLLSVYKNGILMDTLIYDNAGKVTDFYYYNMVAYDNVTDTFPPSHAIITYENGRQVRDSVYTAESRTPPLTWRLYMVYTYTYQHDTLYMRWKYEGGSKDSLFCLVDDKLNIVQMYSKDTVINPYDKDAKKVEYRTSKYDGYNLMEETYYYWFGNKGSNFDYTNIYKTLNVYGTAKSPLLSVMKVSPLTLAILGQNRSRGSVGANNLLKSSYYQNGALLSSSTYTPTVDPVTGYLSSESIVTVGDPNYPSPYTLSYKMEAVK
ncbi:hypothetical protein [Chitinophaga sp. Cy-1792]|uniref:hypothetical protein n=1 Tax=Chitinophaga sp. Cy-1792 TaxID=2608339 RepID=UPI0014236D10|nr:hypothetical protein [Chitinophaga sp. Cy-1792]NIG57295.1 hypothetical protein [Chitinophaga sp. Cy-1792]